MKVYFTFSFFLLALSLQGQVIEPVKLKCQYQTNPIIDQLDPVFSWQIKAGPDDKNVLQTAYQIQVALSEEDLSKGRRLFWDSEKILSDASIHVEYKGPTLSSRQIYYWRVKIWDNQDRESEWSNPQHWEMGLLNEDDWKATWIGPSWEEAERALNPPPIFRKSFSLKKKIKVARLYISAQGIYEVFFNSQRVSDELFAPRLDQLQAPSSIPDLRCHPACS